MDRVTVSAARLGACLAQVWVVMVALTVAIEHGGGQS